MNDIKQTLKERGAIHGDFTRNSEISQELKNVVRLYSFTLTPVMEEALDMIMHKVARILSGDPSHKDHWHDIAGYATLVEERL